MSRDSVLIFLHERPWLLSCSTRVQINRASKAGRYRKPFNMIDVHFSLFTPANERTMING